MTDTRIRIFKTAVIILLVVSAILSIALNVCASEINQKDNSRSSISDCCHNHEKVSICSRCDGSKVCQVCNGNKTIDGHTCSICNGSGKCYFCDGKGTN